MLKSKASELYANFLAKHGTEPEFAECEIEFRDNRSNVDVIIALTSDSTENDDQIFYFCDSFNDLLSLTEKGMEDFVLTDIHGFFNLQ